MNRRRYLGSAASALGIAVAGCLDRIRSAADGATGADDDQTTFADVEIRDVSVTPEVVALNSPDSIGTFGERDKQYVVATVSATGSNAPDYGAFELDAGGTAYAAGDVAGRSRHLWEFDAAYGVDESTEGWVAFTVPKPLDAESAAITWPGGDHPLESSADERLTRLPTEFEVREFAAPASVEIGEEATISVTVENVGDADGTFVGAVNRVGPWIDYAPQAAFSLDVPAGETATWEHGHTPNERHADPDDEDLSMRFHLNWRGDRLTREIEVETE